MDQSQPEKRFSPSRKTLSKREIVVSNKDNLSLTGRSTLAEHVTGIFIGELKSVIKVKRKKEHFIESDVSFKLIESHLKNSNDNC